MFLRLSLAVVLASVFPLRPLAAASPEVEQRVDSLLRKLTLDEKLSLLGGNPDNFSLPAIPSIGLPRLVMADGPQGVRNYGPACHFPSGVALAATWDAGLAFRYGQALGLEARARGVHILLGPGVNICRVPVNGRNFEYFGEDPLLASEMAVNYIRGVQSEGVASTIKHYLANNQETWRHAVSVEMSDRALHEIYLPTFRRAVQEADVAAVMCAYNRFRGEYCGSSSFLLDRVLKGELSFSGLLMSDWGACHATTDLMAGLDLEMGHAENFLPDRVKAAIDRKEVTPERVDDAARRLLRLAVSMGFLDRPQKRDDLPLDSPDSARVALDIARNAIVLLKNEHGLLPLDRKSLHRIAVYGPNALRTPAGGGGSGNVGAFHEVSFLDGIRALAGPGVQVDYVGPVPPVSDAGAFCPLVHTAPNGPAGFSLSATSRHPGGRVELPTQAGVDLRAEKGALPFGVGGEVADFVYTGFLVAPEDGDWEVMASDRVMAEVDGRQRFLVNGDLLHVTKDRPVPIKLTFANLRGGRRPLHRWFSLRPPVLPDLKAARQADVVIFCGGFNASLDTEDLDRSFDLPGLQPRLIRALAEANPRTIVTMNSGAGYDLASWIEPVPAVLSVFYLGQEGGTALGEVLFGEVNPSGRLPDTFDRAFAENPAAANYPGDPSPAHPWPVLDYSEGIFVGYRGYDHLGRTPLFPFGYGLSYTTFAYSDLKVADPRDGVVHVSVTVKNTGSRAGADVVQIYVGQPGCSVERPLRELKAFTKVFLQPGESRTLDLPLRSSAFAYWHPQRHGWTIEPGRFVIEAARSSRDVALTASLALRADQIAEGGKLRGDQ